MWDLTWGSSGEASAEEESDYRTPSGPKVIPAVYTIKLTVDGKIQTHPLKIIMDPRSPATPDLLQQQFQLAQQMFAQTLDARRALAELASVQKQLDTAEQKVSEQNPTLKFAVTEAQAEIAKIFTGKESTQPQSEGLQEASGELASALRVVEGGDRTAPSQAIALYKESSERIKTGSARWSTFKQEKLPMLNQKLEGEGFAPIATGK